jgi:uncharacterized protein involved in exopolysaccharide biosynthesis
VTFTREAYLENPVRNDSGEGASPTSTLTGAPRRRRWLIAGISLLVWAVTVPLIRLPAVSTYVSTATLRISPVLDSIISASEKTGAIGSYEAYVNNQVAIIHNIRLYLLPGG